MIYELGAAQVPHHNWKMHNAALVARDDLNRTPFQDGFQPRMKLQLNDYCAHQQSFVSLS